MSFEIEAKAISVFTGWPIKPIDLGKLLVEIKQHFEWRDGTTIPVIGATLSSTLSPDRMELERLVSTFSAVAQTKTKLVTPDVEVRFIGLVPDATPEKLMLAASAHAQMRQTIVLVNPTSPKLVLELDSRRPIQIGRKIIETINAAAREQFSLSHPAVIWTHVNFISEKAFLGLGAQQNGKTSLLDSVANRALTSEKRNHLSQLVFSGGSFLHKTDSVARSSYGSIVYDSPICRFGKNVIFEGGRTHPGYKAA